MSRAKTKCHGDLRLQVVAAAAANAVENGRPVTPATFDRLFDDLTKAADEGRDEQRRGRRGRVAP